MEIEQLRLRDLPLNGKGLLRTRIICDRLSSRASEAIADKLEKEPAQNAECFTQWVAICTTAPRPRGSGRTPSDLDYQDHPFTSDN